MAKQKVWCPECGGRGATVHYPYKDAFQRAVYGPPKPFYKTCVRCEGRGWIYKASYLEDRLWEIFRLF